MALKRRSDIKENDYLRLLMDGRISGVAPDSSKHAYPMTAARRRGYFSLNALNCLFMRSTALSGFS